MIGSNNWPSPCYAVWAGKLCVTTVCKVYVGCEEELGDSADWLDGYPKNGGLLKDHAGKCRVA